jgi:Holliday junction resolvase-like predicted endonuclease
MRAALFGPVDDEHQAMGALTETAIFSQWSHSDTIDNLHYARWNTGEVDIVWLNFATQKPVWCVEVKWSDQPCSDSRLLKGAINYAKNNEINRVLVTTKTISKTGVFDDVEIEFKSSAAYAYILGANILNEKVLEKRVAKLSAQ